MSTDAGDTPSRLSDALADILSGRERTDDVEAGAGVPGDGIPGEPYVLPEIVPATVETPIVEEPRLPNRSTEVQPATAAVAPAAAAVDAPVTIPQPVAVPATAPVAVPATAWGDHMPATAAPSPTAWGDHMPAARTQLRAPGRRPRVRRVTRVLRHVDPWSTFKIAVVFNAVAYVVCLTSGVLLWRVADSTGTLDNVERWFTQFGWETFELKGDEVFHNAWIIGLFAVVAATGAAVLLVTLFNLVSDIVGGIRMTVLEEEVVERTISSTRRYVVRRPGDISGTSGAAVADWSTDDLDANAGDVEDDRSGEVEVEVSREAQPANSTSDWSID